jgi:DNA mismatch endonuclease (patch repair protein)
MLQTFPEKHRILTDKMDLACDLIGNAVPPLYAKLAARQVLMSIPKKKVMRKEGKWPGNATAERTTFGRLSRSQLMSRVRSRGNATTELRLAALLRKSGLHGWRRHRPLVGKPDFSWANKRLAVFIDGCFWHGHSCGRNLKPKTNAAEWRRKIVRNRARDRRVSRTLREQGWRVLRIWECLLGKNPGACLAEIRRLMSAA